MFIHPTEPQWDRKERRVLRKKRKLGGNVNACSTGVWRGGGLKGEKTEREETDTWFCC